MTDPVARRDWFWMLLPVRWGYPATESPFAGVIPHAETGNLSPFGPMSQPHWNRPGSEGGSQRLPAPQLRDPVSPGPAGHLRQQLGLSQLHPAGPGAPRRPSISPGGWSPILFRRCSSAMTRSSSPPNPSPPVSWDSTPVSSLHFNEDAAALVLNGEPGIDGPAGHPRSLEPDGYRGMTPEVNETPRPGGGRSTSTWGTNSPPRTPCCTRAAGWPWSRSVSRDRAARVNAELNLWEYAGSFRYDLPAGGFRPYLKAGLRLDLVPRREGRRFDGEPLDYTRGRVDQPAVLRSFSGHAAQQLARGGGPGIFPDPQPGPFPRGIDVSLAFEASYTRNSLGIEDWLLLLSADDLRSNSVNAVAMERWTLSAGLNLGF